MQGPPRTIVAATDGTVVSAAARFVAADIGRRAHADVHLVHAWTSAEAPWGQSTTVRRLQALEVVGAERRLLEDDLGCPVAGVHAPRGRPADAILAVADEVGADLVIVGGRRLGPVADLFADHVSQGVVRTAHLPVLLARGDEGAWPPQHVVVGCDGSPEATRAAWIGAWIAGLVGADVVIVGISEQGPGHERRDPSEVTRAVAACADLVAGAGPARVRTRVESGHSVAEVLRATCVALRGRILLALGATGSGALTRPDRPSVSQAFVRGGLSLLLFVPPPILERLNRQRPPRHAARLDHPRGPAASGGVEPRRRGG